MITKLELQHAAWNRTEILTDGQYTTHKSRLKLEPDEK